MSVGQELRTREGVYEDCYADLLGFLSCTWPGLPPRPGTDRTAPSPSALLEGWRPARLPDGSWGSLYAGSNPNDLPQELVGLTITVRDRSGKSWDASITEVVERSPDRLLVRTRRLDQ